MNILKIHSMGKGKRCNHGGFEHAVYPVVMLVEGVHSGANSGGAMFYPAEVIAASTDKWERVPVPIYHPKDNSGSFVLCNSPDVASDWSVGWVEKPRFISNKLVAEIWINVNVAEKKYPGLLDSLDNGKQLEVSTGLLAVEDGVPGKWNEEEYDSTIKEIIPDHLALLPNEIGACSWKDGCGVRANAAIFNEMSHDQISDFIYSYLNNDKNPLNTVSRNDKWVRSIFSSHFIYGDGYDGKRRFFKQNLKIDDDKVVIIGEPIEVREEIKYIPVVQQKTNHNGGKAMSETKKCCPEKVAGIIANVDSGYVEADRSWLELLTEDQLSKIEANVVAKINAKKEAEDAKAALVANQQKKDAPVTLQSYLSDAPEPIRAVLNAGLRELDNKRDMLIGVIKANANNKFTDNQLKGLDTMSLEAIAVLAKKEDSDSQPSFFGGFNGTYVPKTNEKAEEPYVPVTMFGKQ